MSVSRYIYLMLTVILLVRFLFEPQKSWQAEEAQKYKDSIRIASHLRLEFQKTPDSIQKTQKFIHYEDGSLFNLIGRVSRNYLFDPLESFKFSKKSDEDCAEDIFEHQGHTLTYKTCPKKGAFWTEIKLDGKLLTDADIKPLNSPGSFFAETLGINLKTDLDILKIRNHNYWGIKAYRKDCNGSFCLPTNFLLYDLSRNRWYSFLAFSMRDQYSLFMDLNNDGQIDFLELDYTYEGENLTNLYGSNTLIIRAWTQNPQGEFELMKDALGKPYSIKAHFEGGLIEAHNAQIVEQHWMNPIPPKY